MAAAESGMREIRPQDPEMMQELMDVAKRLSEVSRQIQCSVFCLGFQDGTYGVDVRFNGRGFIGRKRPRTTYPTYEMTSASTRKPMAIRLRDINFEDLRDTPMSQGLEPAADSPRIATGGKNNE